MMLWRAIGFLSLAVLGGLLAVGTVSAESGQVSEAQRAKIRSNCTQIKGSLHQLHATDALLRVNRGQVYESMTSRLMTPFNTRLSAGGFDNKAMTTHTGLYTTALATFRTDYISYEQKVAEALRVDCQREPDQFYTLILEARELRRTVHDDVQKLHRIITDYSTSVDDFLLNYKRLAE